MTELTKHLKKGFRGGASIYVAMGINMATGFALSVILVRSLTQEEFGTYRLIGSVILVGTYICSLGLESTLLRFAAEFITLGSWRRLKALIKWFMGMRWLALLLFCLVLFCFKESISHFFNFPEQLIKLLPFVGLILFVQGTNSLWGTAFLSARLEQVKDSINQIAVSLLKLFGFVAVLWMGYGISGIVGVLFTVPLFSFLYYSFVNYRWLKSEQVQQFNENNKIGITSYRKRIKRFAFFNFFAINVNIFKDISIDNFIISHYLGVKEVALYGLASMLVLFVGRFNPASVLRGVLNPIFVSRYTEKGDLNELVWANTFLLKIIIISTLPLYLLLIILGDKIIGIVYSLDYLSAFPALVLLCCFFFFIGLCYPFNVLMNTLEKNELFLITGVFSVYNLMMDIILVPKYGINGAAIATGSAGLFQFFFYWFAFKWYVKLNITFPWKALAQTIGNCIAMAVFVILIKPHIENVVLLIITAGCSGLIYLGFLYINNVFDSQEKSLFVRAQPKLAPLLRMKTL